MVGILVNSETTMFCDHGLPSENCPHCMKSMGIKPPTQLVTPRPREIPMPSPSTELFTSEKKPMDLPFYSENRRFPGILDKPVRKLDLSHDITKDRNPLFTKKREELLNKWNSSEEAKEILKSQSILDIRKKFTN